VTQTSTRHRKQRAGRIGHRANTRILALAAILGLPAAAADQQDGDATSGSRSSAQGEFGPQIYLRAGAVRPYVFGTLGVAYLAGDMGVSGRLGREPFDVTAELSDFGVYLGAGGGFSVQVRGGDYPVAVDVSGSYHHGLLADGPAGLGLLASDRRRAPRSGCDTPLAGWGPGPSYWSLS